MTTESSVPATNETLLQSDPCQAVIVERFDTQAVVRLLGDLDATVEHEVTRAIADAASGPGLTEVHVDATKVTFIDSSGLRSLLLARQAVLERGLTFSVAVTSDGPVARLLTLTGVDQALAAQLI